MHQVKKVKKTRQRRTSEVTKFVRSRLIDMDKTIPWLCTAVSIPYRTLYAKLLHATPITQFEFMRLVQVLDLDENKATHLAGLFARIDYSLTVKSTKANVTYQHLLLTLKLKDNPDYDIRTNQ